MAALVTERCWVGPSHLTPDVHDVKLGLEAVAHRPASRSLSPGDGRSPIEEPSQMLVLAADQPMPLDLEHAVPDLRHETSCGIAQLDGDIYPQSVGSMTHGAARLA
jgi:hypothetical protein